MASIEKSTITIPTAAAIVLALLTIGGGIIGNYYATRSAVAVELNQIKNDLRFEVAELKNADELIRLRVANNTAALLRIEALAIKPEEPRIKDHE